VAGDYAESIRLIKKGEEDPSGTKIINIFVKYNEFAIYEVEDSDINNRLKVLIDGYTPEREEDLTNRFNNVKQNYIKAKGLLYRSSNFGMMKNRIAHLLSTIFTTEDQELDGNKEFEKLIAEIEAEYSKSIAHRLWYLLPSILISVAVGCYMYSKYPDWYENKTELWELLCVVSGALIGGTMSIVFRIGKNNFEEHLSTRYYFFTGIERIILSIFAGAIAYAGVKSGILFGNIDNKGYWTIVTISILAGFSESLIPGLLTKVSSDKQEG
jgi:Txe/YoeB family toxin of Txe-Axe toxin-antitoxin module